MKSSNSAVHMYTCMHSACMRARVAHASAVCSRQSLISSRFHVYTTSWENVRENVHAVRRVDQKIAFLMFQPIACQLAPSMPMP